jgi:hypothetical protein
MVTLKMVVGLIHRWARAIVIYVKQPNYAEGSEVTKIHVSPMGQTSRRGLAQPPYLLVEEPI